MTEQIRAEQIAQGFEPCFGTDRVINGIGDWYYNNCINCSHFAHCRAIQTGKEKQTIIERNIAKGKKRVKK